MSRKRMSFAGKVLGAGVFAKAVLMASIVTVLSATTFGESIALVLVSATATGVFALLVVFIQVHSERAIHERIDKLEASGSRLEERGSEIVEQTTAIKSETSEIAAKVKNGERDPA